MTLPTEPIGSIPRVPGLIGDAAVADTIRRMEETGSPVVTDGEQTKPSFATYPIAGITSLSPDGAVIPFADGHTRQLPLLTAAPFRYSTYAAEYLNAAQRHTQRPVKQAVIAPSALSLLYPPNGIEGYSREAFLDDLANEAEADIRGCLDAGAHTVQLDFTEGRLSLKLDPSGGLLDDFIALNNNVLSRFSDAERARIGVHTCPGGDQDSTHSADVDYVGLMPKLFTLLAGSFYVQLASEADPAKVLQIIADNLPAAARVFVGVIDPLDPRVETPEEVRDRTLAAAQVLSADRLGTCDDCGFSPFADDVSTSRDVAFAKIRSRVKGTALAASALGI
jgi:5-methyltetrahydropteroyltriglutamate--homocysteine methyltransferase